MKGIELSRKYFEDCGKDKLKSLFSEIWDQIAVGIVGEGSECFGFDDNLSQDHDFGPGFCIFIPRSKYHKHGEKLQNFYDSLPEKFMGYSKQNTGTGRSRTGVFAIEDFYLNFLGVDPKLLTLKEWLNIPEEFLATATNGEVFLDNLGEFTKIREKLLDYYPADIIKKKLSANLATIAQAGQYNFLRSKIREDISATFFSKTEFLEATFRVLFLLEGVYMPFYKWRMEALKEKCNYPPKLYEDLEILMGIDSDTIIDRVCLYIKDIIRYKGWGNTNSNFILDLAYEVQSGIQDQEIKKLNIWIGGKVR